MSEAEGPPAPPERKEQNHMSDNFQLAAEPKEGAGKGAARAARRAGRVPGIIYGAKKTPVMITLDPKDPTSILWSSAVSTSAFAVEPTP